MANTSPEVRNIPQVIPVGIEGRVSLGPRDHLHFTVAYDDRTDKASLRLERHLLDEEGNLQPAYACDNPDTTLYFDREGQIVDRAPFNPQTSARACQEKYAGSIENYLNGILPKDVVQKTSIELTKNSISGFFNGEDGISRDTEYTVGEVTKVLHQSML
jgi:hypothetical protein